MIHTYKLGVRFPFLLFICMYRRAAEAKLPSPGVHLSHCGQRHECILAQRAIALVLRYATIHYVVILNNLFKV